MSDILKGNFKTRRNVEAAKQSDPADDSLETRFEREALKRLGGSIAFVSKKKVDWNEKK